MPDVYAYTDYRLFLADYYHERKAITPAFSYQLFSDKAGFSNRGFIYNVIKGVKNLSRSSAAKLARALQFDAKEADYFENLVAFNQARTLAERNHFFEKINSIKSNRQGSAVLRETRHDQYEFYAEWYIAVIRSYISLHPFKGDFRELARSLTPPIRPKEAKKAVAILENLGMVRKGGNGVYEVTDQPVTAGREVVQLGLQNFQLQTMELAQRALQVVPGENRHLSGLTLGISKTCYENICRDIQKFQERLVSLAENDPDADRVYQLNFQVFPVSE